MALLAASSSSSTAFSAKTYDVFISFRGEDTRTNFTSHLHDAFRRKQIATYIDYRLHKGDEISASLLQAIEDSYVSVVVFSKNYATSRWCLDELIHILQCRRDQGQIVIPVFYKVEPSHVRNQSGTYEQAFQKHERDLKHSQGKMHWWKAALTEAANLAGWDSLTFRDESELIQKIVKDVLRKLYHRYPPTELKGLVGVDNNCAEIDLLLREVQSVGIWGMGGIGKTTIARAIFVKYSSQYESCCFLKNVRENFENLGIGPHDLRYRLLSQLLHEEDLLVHTSITESPFVKCRLTRKKVFVVLDDVSTLEQLEYLAGELDCFGPGSKIIITTRDKHVLSKRVDVIYEVKELEFRNSLHLFCLNAFNQSLPIIRYEELSKRAVAYANGIPLTLKVLGSFLRGKSENEWDSALRKLKNIPNKNILKVLRSSYDGLDCVEKKIFLYIACFLEGDSKKSVISILDGCGFYGAIGIKTLEDNALITITSLNDVEMHDLIQKMGREIVREESIKKPERRSILWDTEEVCDVLSNNKGTDAIEGIQLDLSLTKNIKNMHLCADTFTKMTNLIFLKLFCYPCLRRLCDIHLEKGLKSFPDTIRILEWYGYPLESLPSTFCPTKLVILRMRNSQVEKLWDGVQDVVNLKEIDLFGSHRLLELPDFSKASNLKRVSLSYCSNLRDVHPSILLLHSLTELTLKGCKKLESLKSEKHLRSLTCVTVNGCSNLKEFSVSSDALTRLDLRNTGIEILHSSIGRSSRLKKLHLNNGSRIENFHELSCLRSLTKLSLCSCESIDDWKLYILFDSLLSLEYVYLDNCSNITELPSNTKHLSKLTNLSLNNCMRLRSLPELPPSIVKLEANNCTSLETVFTLKNDGSKHISFENCVKLDEQSLGSIIEHVYSSMMQAAYMPNKYEIGGRRRSFCLPGSKVPDCFEYRTRGASITIELPPPSLLLGFLFCIVFGPSILMDHVGCPIRLYVAIRSNCYLGDFMVGMTNFPGFVMSSKPNGDNVYLWYPEWQCESILESIEGRIGNDEFVTNLTASFKFNVGGNVANVKECGVCPVYLSGYQDFIRRKQLDANNKRSRNVDEQELLPQFKKLKLGLDIQSNTRRDIDELEAMFTRMNVTRNPDVIA